jgi:hypothetical protein
MDLARQLCTTEGCPKRRRYGWAMKKPIKCREHAETGMENVIPYEKCLGSDGGDVCTKRPNYGWPGQKKRTHCKAHCQPGMEDLNNRKCGCPDGTMSGCKLRPKFGFPGACCLILSCKNPSKEASFEPLLLALQSFLAVWAGWSNV